jgi:hypothetical protein
MDGTLQPRTAMVQITKVPKVHRQTSLLRPMTSLGPVIQSCSPRPADPFGVSRWSPGRGGVREHDTLARHRAWREAVATMAR